VRDTQTQRTERYVRSQGLADDRKPGANQMFDCRLARDGCLRRKKSGRRLRRFVNIPCPTAVIILQLISYHASTGCLLDICGQIEAEQNLKEEEQKGAEHKEAEQNGEDQKEEQKELQKMLTESKEKSDVEVGEVVQANEGEKGKTNAETAESGNGVTEPTSQETSNEASNEASRESAEDSKGDRKSEMDTDSADIKDDAMKV
jgi:hypothetical protein